MANKSAEYSLVKRLELKNFRCFTKKIITFDKRVALIEGENGVGKTSLLESLYYGCYLRSFRTNSPQEMVTFGSEGFFIKIDIEQYHNGSVLNQQIQIGFVDGKRRVKIDGNPIASYKELMNSLRVISLTEDDMHLIKGAPQERRTFLDHAIVLENSDCAHQLNLLRHIILARNALLRPHGSIKMVDYQVLTEQLWDQSIIIQKLREQYIKQLEQEINILIKAYFNDEFALEIRYLYKKPMENSVALFMAANPTLFESEARLGRSCFGAHMDDLLITYNTKKSRHFASRGQQKLILLLVKAAQIIILQKQCPATILFLLDDYMTDFDDYRAGVLLKIMQNLNIQLIFTSPTTLGLLNIQNVGPEGGSCLVSLKNS
jgi:DNA replication and repair protein RecF